MDEFTEKVNQLIMPQYGNLKQDFFPNINAFAELYKKSAETKTPLVIKLGIDPTSTELHLGHTLCLFTLKRFYEHGHKPVIIIGGFTATVGDPSGRNEARPPLSYEKVKENAQTYLSQIKKILPNIREIGSVEELNSELESKDNTPVAINNYIWFSKFNLANLIELAHMVTVNKLVAKEAFGNRLDKNEPLYLHEVLYPLLQGYDSKEITADIEIGGSDQTFNVLFGRDVQKFFKQSKIQCALLNPLLIGLDGQKKMSKTFNNYISLNDSPNEMFGKVMSIPDELIVSYFNLTSVSSIYLAEIIKTLKEQSVNPRDIKIELAKNIIKQFYSDDFAVSACENFINQFQKSEIPSDVEEFKLAEDLKIVELMLSAGLVASKGEAKRFIDGGGVKLKSIKVTDVNLLVTSEYKGSVLQIGKRKFVKIV